MYEYVSEYSSFMNEGPNIKLRLKADVEDLKWLGISWAFLVRGPNLSGSVIKIWNCRGEDKLGQI